MDRLSIFFEVYEPLPRQGPGSRTSAARAIELCTDLPERPAVLDLGCGAGGQTFHLASLTAGCIVAVDNHVPNIDRLREAAADEPRIQPRVEDIAHPCHAHESFDLIWSEGALYNIGIGNALRLYQPILRAGGYFAFTEAVWLAADPPDEVVASFAEYPAMGNVADVLAIIEESGFSLVDHFPLPDDDWWNDFYEPMERRIEQLRVEYVGNAEALAVLDEIAREPQMHREHSSNYGYEFFVVRRTA